MKLQEALMRNVDEFKFAPCGVCSDPSRAPFALRPVQYFCRQKREPCEANVLEEDLQILDSATETAVADAVQLDHFKTIPRCAGKDSRTTSDQTGRSRAGLSTAN